MSPARITVVGLGPAGPEVVPEATRVALAGALLSFLRTRRHPAAAVVGEDVESFDELYDSADDFDSLYGDIVERLVEAATAHPGSNIVYAVPGSPLVAERSVALLRTDRRVEVEIVPAPSFLDLAWDRLGIDPLDAGVRLVDAADFAVRAAGDSGPLLVAQCHSRRLLSEMKLAVDDPSASGPSAVLLHHLGLPDEQVLSVEWSELDRSIEPDHLTTVWIPSLASPVAAELMRLDAMVRVLWERCPWDRAQTHGSLGRHLLEEAYEALDAIEAFAAAEPDVPAALVDHLEEELGDLLFQVVLHAALATEEGRFTLADVARTVHDKLVGRHPHVFGDAVADTPEEVASRWEQLKRAEKGRSSVTDGIPAALPALALAAKLQRKAESLSFALPDAATRRSQLVESVASWPLETAGASGETLEAPAEEARQVGEALFALADLARRLGVDPETALRAYARRFRGALEASE